MQNGCITFSGIDAGTGQLLHITEWKINYHQLQANCSDCNEMACTVHNPLEIIENIKKQMELFKKLKHDNLINYETFEWKQNKNDLIIRLAREFVSGSTVKSITKWNGLTYSVMRLIVTGLLEAVNYLHCNGILHGHLNDSSVFIDDKGVCRVADFYLFQYLNNLSCGLSHSYAISPEQSDSIAIGDLAESFGVTSGKIKNFIKQCKSSVDLPCLMNHPFLKKISTSSRLDDEYEVLKHLGSGGFGDVLKVKNYHDENEYAIKRIPLTSEEAVNNKSKNEVKLLSALHHDNIVRYYVSWSEIINKTMYDQYKSTDSMEVDTGSSFGSSILDQLDLK